jgi:hypothetical protein
MLQVQSQFETVVKRFNKEQKEVEDLLQIRDQAYLDLLAGSDGQAVVPKQQTSPQKGQNACEGQDSTFTLMISITAHRKQDVYRTVFLIADTNLPGAKHLGVCKAMAVVCLSYCGIHAVLLSSSQWLPRSSAVNVCAGWLKGS